MSKQLWKVALGAALVIGAAPLASAQTYDFNPTLRVQNFVGVGTLSPGPGGTAGIEIAATGNPAILLRRTVGGIGYGQMYDDGLNLRLVRWSPTGSSSFWFEPQVADGASPVEVRFFRTSNTTGARQVNFFQGNGTNAVQARIAVDSTNSWFNLSGGNVGFGTNTPTEKLSVTGNIRATGTVSGGVVEIRGAGNDLAEGFKVNGPADAIQPGMVVSISPDHPGEMMLSQAPYERTVAGIISGAGDKHVGIQLGNADEVASGELMPVALTGQAWCWVDASFGAVRPGDTLTTSATLGHAMKVTDFNLAMGSIIGKAMTSLDEGRGLVLVLVNLH